MNLAKMARKEISSPDYEALANDPAVTEFRELTFVKTHCLPNEENLPGIYIIRDGRDAIVSQTHFVYEVYDKVPVPVNTPAFFDRMRHLISREKPFGTWGQNVSAWTKRPNTAVIMFEDLIREPIKVMCNALETLGLSASINHVQEIPSFENLHTKNPKHFRKGRVGSWREDMPKDLQKFFWEQHGSVASRFGFTE